MSISKQVLDILGGGEKISKNANVYKLNNDEVILIKCSSRVNGEDHYMYGIRPLTLESNHLDAIVFVLDNEGFVKIPFNVFHNEYVPNLSQKVDAHFHIHIRNLTLKARKKSWDLRDFFTPFNW